MADEDFQQRLDDALKDNDLKIDRKGHAVDKTQPESTGGDLASGYAYGMRIAVEFTGGTVVGFFIGWGLDKVFDTAPLWMLVFTFLGFGAGFLNVYRTMNGLDEGIGINRAKDRQKERQNGLTDVQKQPKSSPTD